MNTVFLKSYSVRIRTLLTLFIFFSIYSCKKSSQAPAPLPNPVIITSINPATGPHSSVVTIAGSGFASSATGDSVKFNGVTAVVQQATATQLTVIVPKSAGIGTVTVRVGTQSATGPVFNYVFTVTVTTLVGNNGGGYLDGNAAQAKVSNPFGITTDGQDNVYVSEFGNSTVRKISPTSVVSTLAGAGTAGFADGTGAATKFNFPSGIVADLQGNIFVADQVNHRIRKISGAGIVSTIAGTGGTGLVNGQGNLAQFFSPTGITLDPQGNLLIADAGNNTIRKITPAGVVSTFAGTNAGFADGDVNTAKFHDPTGIAADALGNVYVADHINHRIRKISTAGLVTTLAGSGVPGFADGNGSEAQFDTPVGIAMDIQGNLLVADGNNHRIRKITPGGLVSTLAGSGVRGAADGDASLAQFLFPYGISSDTKGNIFVADFSNHRIRKILIE